MNTGLIRGGTAPNIIPERTKAWFMLRSPDQHDYERMKVRFRELVEGARDAQIVLIGVAAASFLAMEVMSRWYERRRTRTAPA